jgi:hypothetical protein
MVLKNVVSALAGAGLLLWSGASFADQYKPGEFFNLDLSKAVLSPEPLGPETQFAPVRIEANSGNSTPAPAVQPLPPRKTAAHIRIPKTKVAETRVVEHHRSGQPHHPARTRLAHRHSNPLDAEAMDTRIQVWPCRSGGICNWQQQR